MVEAFQNMGNHSLVMLICWLLFLLVSVFIYFRKQVYTTYFLFAAAICIAAAFALFSPWLYPWDEQFHALVGKNLAKDPSFPKLYPYHPLKVEQNWLNTVVWLHKQPLFTWQIALSVKLFGTSTFAVRLPSVLFHGILVVTVFRIGKIVFNPRTGFIAALFVMHSSFLLGLISGRIGTDHNDYIFLCYITLSCWAWFGYAAASKGEWDFSTHKKWLYWIGIFAGCAILTKWLVGLLVFAGWGAVILASLKKGKFWSSIKPLLISFGISMLVAIPWQVYTFIRFPEEAGREMEYNSAHVFHALENHSGNAWYHFDQIRLLYFNQTDFFILFFIGLIFLMVRKVRRDYKIYFVVTIGITYLFFTLAQTKMPAFTTPVFGFVMLIMAYGITEITRLIPFRWVRRSVLVLLTLLVVNLMLKPSPTLANYGFHKNKEEMEGRKSMMKAYALMKSKGSDSPRRIVFGVDDFRFANISWMFFNDEIAYPFIPSEKEIKRLESKGYTVVVLKQY